MSYGESAFYLLMAAGCAYLLAFPAVTIFTPRAHRQSIFLLLVGVGAAILIAVVISFAVPPPAFSGVARSLGAPAAGAAIYVVGEAVIEEGAKAAGIGVTRMRANAFSWFWTVACVAGVLGAIERLLLALNFHPSHWPHPLLLLALDARGIAAHIALSLICTMVARRLGGGWKGWPAGILVAGAVHALLNFAPRLEPAHVQASMPLLDELISGVFAVVIIAFSYAHRRKLVWRNKA